MTEVLGRHLLIAFYMYQLLSQIESRTDLQGIKFMDVKANDSEVLMVPFLGNESEVGTFCYNEASFQNLVLLSLTLCKRLDFIALQRIYPVAKHDFSINSGKGLKVNLQCSSPEMQLDECHITSVTEGPCSNYLGIQCAGCNNSVKMDPYGKLLLEFPGYLLCSPNWFCEWNIETDSRVKELFVELKINNHTQITPPPLMFMTRYVEIEWPNEETNEWILATMNENNLSNQSKLIIKSNRIIVKYFAPGCHLIQRQNILAEISTGYMRERGHSNRSGSVLYVLLSMGILIVGIGLIATCLCCHRKKNGTRSWNRSPFLSSRTQMIPERVNETDEVIVAFRDFVRSSRNLIEQSGELKTEDSKLDLESSESPGTSSKFMNVPQEDNGEKGSRKRCPSFEVKTVLPFSHSPDASKAPVQTLCKKSAEPAPEKHYGSSSPEHWGSPHSESDAFLSHPSSASEASYFSA